MRAVLAVVIFFSCAATAGAKPSPVETPRLTPPPAELAVAVGAAGAMIESDYFQAPQARLSSHGALACRLHSEIFSKTRLALACH
ncbi:MAG TPA: hypothetical protein VN655_06645 [Pseudolabrys sp.]|jgi:hypothetical protein|nr:hypothetical protein [Pseudolabrys sp.]